MPGHWEGSDPEISFDVTGDGKIENLSINAPFDDPYNAGDSGFCPLDFQATEVQEDSTFTTTYQSDFSEVGLTPAQVDFIVENMGLEPDSQGLYAVNSVQGEFTTTTRVTGDGQVSVCGGVFIGNLPRFSWSAEWKEPLTDSNEDAEETTGGQETDIGVPFSDENWEVTVTEIHEETSIKTLFGDSYSPVSGQKFLVVVADIHNSNFDPSMPLSDTDLIVNGIHLSEADADAASGKYALSHVTLYDEAEEEYTLVAWGVGDGEDNYVMADNLTDLSVASPEDAIYRFVFAVGEDALKQGVEFQFEDLPRIQLSLAAESVSVPSQLDVTLTDSYETSYGLSFMHPSGWTVLDTPGDLNLALASSIENFGTTLTSGQMIVIFVGPFQTGQFDVSTLLSALDFSTNHSDDEASQVLIGDHPALRVPVTDALGDGFSVVFEVSDELSMMAIGFTAPGELPQYEPLLMDIIESATYAISEAVVCEAVVTANANLRLGPGTNFDVIMGVQAGEAVQILGQDASGDWYQIQLAAISGSDFMWISSQLVSVPECPDGSTPPITG